MTWPHGRYLDYLTGIANLDDVEVRHMLDSDGFPPMDDADLARVRYLLDQPPDFDAFDEGHAASQAWLRQRGLQGVVRGDPSVLPAFRLLRSPWRLPAEALLLSGMSPASVAEFLQQHKAGEATGAIVERFASLFWAVNEVAPADLATYFQTATAGAIYADVMGKSMDEALTLATSLVNRRAGYPWVNGKPRSAGAPGVATM